MIDPIFRDWLQSQVDQATDLAAHSDIVELGMSPYPWHWYDGLPCGLIARFKCLGMMQLDERTFEPQTHPFAVQINIQPDHLRRMEPFELVTWLGPHNIWHPNIRGRGICIGKVHPGYELVQLLHQLYEIITYQNHAENDPMNEPAAEWARRNTHRFPLERRSLRRFAAK